MLIMAFPSSPLWKRLPLPSSHRSDGSVLFFAFERQATGLKLQITDLVHLWTALNTSREELKEEAARTRCAIDPTEDEEQYEVLVSKLEEAMSGREDARVRLVGNGEASTPLRFGIETSIRLPPPLNTLDWTFRVVRQEPSVLTRELILPALCVVDASLRREEELRRKIREKDHVIGRLLDKIEGSGIDLSMVFPGFTGARKGLSARQAARVVPGIEAFREEKREDDLNGGYEGGIREILKALADPKSGVMTWKGPMASIEESNGEQRGCLKDSLDQSAQESQVRVFVLRRRKIIC